MRHSNAAMQHADPVSALTGFGMIPPKLSYTFEVLASQRSSPSQFHIFSAVSLHHIGHRHDTQDTGSAVAHAGRGEDDRRRIGSLRSHLSGSTRNSITTVQQRMDHRRVVSRNDRPELPVCGCCGQHGRGARREHEVTMARGKISAGCRALCLRLTRRQSRGPGKRWRRKRLPRQMRPPRTALRQPTCPTSCSQRPPRGAIAPLAGGRGTHPPGGRRRAPSR